MEKLFQPFRWWLLFITFLLLILLGYTFLIPSTHAVETTTGEKVLTFLKDVLGLNLATYRMNIDSYVQNWYMEILPLESVKCVLESNESKLSMICEFVDGRLYSMSLYVLYGSPRMAQPAANVLEMAKGFISIYQTYAGASYCQEMKTILDMVKVNEDVAKVSGNIKFEAKYEKKFIEWERRTVDLAGFRWTYTLNGVEAPSKCVALYFEQGFLKYFVDTWWIYKIGSTSINVDEKKAVEIAIKAAKNYSWKVYVGNETWMEVKEFNIAGVSKATLTFCNNVTKEGARGGDPLTLYPSWCVDLYLDKLYLGNVYGISVGIWADTEEVYDIRTKLLLEDHPPNGEANGAICSNNGISSILTKIIWIALPASIIIPLITTYYRRRKRICHEFYKALKSDSLKVGGLCLLISLVIFAIVMPMVKASSYVMALYGSRAGMVEAERNAAMWIIYHGGRLFREYGGYTTYDLYGSQTQKQIVLDNAAYFEEVFDCVAMFYHGHGGFRYISNPQILRNGGFETGYSYWTVGGPGDHVVTSEDRYNGSYSLLLGFKYQPNVADGRDYAYQLITIPSYASNVRLSFWYHLFTEDSDHFDSFEVYIAPVGGDPVLVFRKGGVNYPGWEEYGWEQKTIDLSAYAGQSIYVYFSVVNRYDILYKTYCYIDDVRYEVKHWDLLDDNWDINNPSINDEIYDFEVYPQTWRSKHFFVILWACRQGDIEGYYDYSAGKAVGMPFSWHHPVTNYDCFIGFKDASMPLTQISNHTNVIYMWWLYRVIVYLTYYHYTIMEALDRASMYYFNLPFYETELAKGFEADWPEYPGWPAMPPSKGWMNIYGNPNIRVY